MQQEPHQRKFADPDTDYSGAEPDQGKTGRDTRRDTVGRAFRRGVERGTAGAVKAVLRGLLTAAIVLIALYFGWRQLPALFSGRATVTDLAAEHRLEAIGEFAAYQYAYSGVKEKRDTRTLLDSIPIPGTTNYQKYAYNGAIRVGYAVSDIGIHVDGQRGEIVVKLPEPSVLSNTIEQDLSVYEQVNNILNPIRGNAVAEMEQEIKSEELENAKAEGLFELAEEHAKELITGLLSAFEGYKVVFE